MKHTVEFIDLEREPRHQFLREHMHGLDLDLSRGVEDVCVVPVPWPAERCGYWMIRCAFCGLSTMITAAGRVDDPRSVKLACKHGRMQ